ncbi:MAG: putative N-formylglutamate amidohydrolase [Paracoccaceae bacterium]|jgi:predicted N-formylglutamate amidohydrolase
MPFMITASESPLLHPNERPAAHVINAHGTSQVVLVCEHASRYIPAALDNLGLDGAAAQSHVAWDIGALELATTLSDMLDAPLVASRISRLVYDCNRPPEAPGAIPAQSERFAIPGNATLSDGQKAARADEVYYPFRALLGQVLDNHPVPPVLITIHSFTPVFHGKPRAVELGILHDSDDRMALALLGKAQRKTNLNTALNQPYSATDGVTHTLRDQAGRRGLANVMIEVRNDLIDTPAGVARLAGLLGPMLRDAAGQFAGADIGDTSMIATRTGSAS